MESGRIQLAEGGTPAETREAGSTLAEMSVFFETPCKFSAYALVGSYCWLLSRTSFRQLSRIYAVDCHMQLMFHIKDIPELEVLSVERRGRLIAALGSISYPPSHFIFTKGR